jgi:hypothetical protein
MNDERQPWWTVTAVFDPDGGGGDFGYTEGLATAGVPELHLWARPSLGEDPGLDWKLSQRDTCRLLNHLAWRLLDGKLAVGDTWVETYDEGLTEARFTVHEPVAATEVDAFGAGESPVLPIKWELRRPALGEPRSMEPEAEADAAFELLDPASCIAADSALRSRGHDLGTLQVWLTSLATVLTERAALDPAVVGVFLEAGRRVAGLERLVHSPLSTEAA